MGRLPRRNVHIHGIGGAWVVDLYVFPCLILEKEQWQHKHSRIVGKWALATGERQKMEENTDTRAQHRRTGTHTQTRSHILRAYLHTDIYFDYTHVRTQNRRNIHKPPQTTVPNLPTNQIKPIVLRPARRSRPFQAEADNRPRRVMRLTAILGKFSMSGALCHLEVGRSR